MGRGTKNSTVGRRNHIIQSIREKGEIFIHELSEEFKVSEVTIRKDLEQLEKKNLLVRARGGAMNIDRNVGFDRILSDKVKLNLRQKTEIGKRAAQMIREGDTIIIDSGTTTAELVRNLPELQSLNVVTNAMNIVNLLANVKATIIIPGGYLRQNSMSLVGPMAEKNLLNLSVDKAFIGADGFDTQVGVYTPNIDEAHLNEIMINIAREVIVLADSTKFNKRSLSLFCPLSKIDKVITDAAISDADRKHLQDADIELIIA
ncbi:MAG: DeoR/GlpR transcriptional regulator [Chitinophagaceae bacterium]|nr:DeoR/GlpR transcriptional regulator [Chitinophagaceae bacterium]